MRKILSLLFSVAFLLFFVSFFSQKILALEIGNIGDNCNTSSSGCSTNGALGLHCENSKWAQYIDCGSANKTCYSTDGIHVDCGGVQKSCTSLGYVCQLPPDHKSSSPKLPYTCLGSEFCYAPDPATIKAGAFCNSGVAQKICVGNSIFYCAKGNPGTWTEELSCSDSGQACSDIGTNTGNPICMTKNDCVKRNGGVCQSSSCTGTTVSTATGCTPDLPICCQGGKRSCTALGGGCQPTQGVACATTEIINTDCLNAQVCCALPKAPPKTESTTTSCASGTIDIGAPGCSYKLDSTLAQVKTCKADAAGNCGICVPTDFSTNITDNTTSPPTIIKEDGVCKSPGPAANSCSVCVGGVWNPSNSKCASLNVNDNTPIDPSVTPCPNTDTDHCDHSVGCVHTDTQVLSLCNGGTCLTAIGPLPTDIQGLLTRVFSIILAIAGVAALGLIIASGYKLMTSQGNPEMVKGIREQLTAAIIGLLFIIFSLVILQVIGGNILNIFK